MHRIDAEFDDTGSRIGVQIRIDGAMSSRQPNASSRTLISGRITFLSLDNVNRIAVTLAGTCISAMT